MPKQLRIDSDTRKVDALAGEGSLTDMLRRRRLAIQEGDLEEAQRITQEFTQRDDEKKKR